MPWDGGDGVAGGLLFAQFPYALRGSFAALVDGLPSW